MRFLFFEGDSEIDTRIKYLNEELSALEDVESFLYTRGVDSVYNALDVVNPDIVCCDIHSIPSDLITYMSKEKHKAKLVLLSDSRDSVENLMALQQRIEEEKVDFFKFISTSQNADKNKKLKVVRVTNGYDRKCNTYLDSQKPRINFKYQTALFCNTLTTPDQYQYVLDSVQHFHPLYVDTNKPRQIKSGISMPQYIDILFLFRHYDEVIFTGIDRDLPQAFFDCLGLGKKTYYICNNEESSKRSSEVIAKVFGDFNLDYQSEEKLSDFTDIQKIVHEKHSSYNRAKSFLSQMPKIKQENV